jgi:hypothetical protein
LAAVKPSSRLAAAVQVVDANWLLKVAFNVNRHRVGILELLTERRRFFVRDVKEKRVELPASLYAVLAYR